MIEVNEVRQASSVGGGMKQSELMLFQPKVTFVGSRDDAEREWVLTSALKSLKHDSNHPSSKYKRIDVMPACARDKHADVTECFKKV